MTPNEALLAQVELQLASASVGSIAATELLRLKARLLGLPERTENPAEIPLASKVKTLESEDGWVNKYEAMKTYGEMPMPKPLHAVMFRLDAITESFEDRCAYSVGCDNHEKQLMTRPDGSVLTLAALQKLLDDGIAALGLDKELLEQFMTEPNAAVKHRDWYRLPFQERMNRFRRTAA